MSGRATLSASTVMKNSPRASARARLRGADAGVVLAEEAELRKTHLLLGEDLL